MTWYIRTALSVAAVVCITLSPISLWAGPDSSNIDGQVDKASQALQNQEYDKVVALLEPLENQSVGESSSVRIQYLLGSAKFRGTDQELKDNREKGLQRKDQLNENQVVSLREASQHFKAAREIDPKGPYAPECLYMTGKILDWGYMQRFNESLANYSATYESYPGTEFGVKAQESYKNLRSKMSPHHSDPNMKLGTPTGKSH